MPYLTDKINITTFHCHTAASFSFVAFLQIDISYNSHETFMAWWTKTAAVSEACCFLVSQPWCSHGICTSRCLFIRLQNLSRTCYEEVKERDSLFSWMIYKKGCWRLELVQNKAKVSAHCLYSTTAQLSFPYSVEYHNKKARRRFPPGHSVLVLVWLNRFVSLVCEPTPSPLFPSLLFLHLTWLNTIPCLTGTSLQSQKWTSPPPSLSWLLG